MAKIIFSVFFTIITTVTNAVLLPINLLIDGLFPSFASLISNFNTNLARFFGPSLSYFFSILPTNTRSFIMIYLGILISYYTISISVHAILKVYTIIKNIKFW